MAVDEPRDVVFIPTGSASPDFYGGLRPGDNRYANSVTALRASSGKLLWSSPIPPVPASAMNSYGPTRCPAAFDGILLVIVCDVPK